MLRVRQQRDVELLLLLHLRHHRRLLLDLHVLLLLRVLPLRTQLRHLYQCLQRRRLLNLLKLVLQRLLPLLRVQHHLLALRVVLLPLIQKLLELLEVVRQLMRLLYRFR